MPDEDATFRLRSPDEIAAILHRGAKVKRPLQAPFISDASGLVTWLAPDRGKVVFRGRAEIEQHQSAFAAMIRTWLDEMDREHHAS